jgi:uncharacterized membrane protein
MAQTAIEKINKEYPIKNVNKLHRAKLSKMDKLALLVTDRIGTMGFFFIIFAWTLIWLGWNVFAPKKLRFDPYPAFVFWLFISNLIQLHLMPLLLIGQNVQGKHAELRSEHDFETDKKAEKEIEAILNRLNNQERLLQEILEKLKENK